MTIVSNDFDSLRDAISKELGVEKMANSFEDKLRVWNNQAATDFLKSGTSLNQTIAEIATLNKLNDDQISCIVQEANTKVFLLKYEKTKGEKVRRPSFPIASLTGVKDLMGNKTTANTTDTPSPETTTRGIGGGNRGMTKQASFEELAKDSFLTDTSSQTYGMYDNFDPVTAQAKIMERRASEANAKRSAEMTKMAREYLGTLHTASESLVQYTKLGHVAQDIFEYMVKEAGLNENQQEIMINSYALRSAGAKLEGKIPVSLTTSLTKLASGEEEVEDFSLGKYGSAQAKSKTPNIPQIEADSQVINAKQLVALAKRLKDQHQELANASAKEAK